MTTADDSINHSPHREQTTAPAAPLPPLPDPNRRDNSLLINGLGYSLFTSDQMLDYAHSALAAAQSHFDRTLSYQAQEAGKRIRELEAAKDSWYDTAAQHARNQAYYMGLLDECAKHIGLPAYTADDQGVCQEPLRAKIPECVLALQEKCEAAESTLSERDAEIERLKAEKDNDYRIYVEEDEKWRRRAEAAERTLAEKGREIASWQADAHLQYARADRAELRAAQAQKDAERASAYEEAFRVAYKATFQSHTGHWDMKGTSGANCPECLRAQEARENCDALLHAAIDALRAEGSGK